MAPADNDVIIPIVEGLNGHKQLIQAVRNESIDDLLKNYVGYQYLYDAVEYQAVERLTSYQDNMFLPCDTVDCVSSNHNGFCGHKAMRKAFKLFTKTDFCKMGTKWQKRFADVS